MQVQVERVQRAKCLSACASAKQRLRVQESVHGVKCLSATWCLSAERASGVQQALTLWGELGAAPVQLLLVQRECKSGVQSVASAEVQVFSALVQRGAKC